MSKKSNAVVKKEFKGFTSAYKQCERFAAEPWKKPFKGFTDEYKKSVVFAPNDANSSSSSVHEVEKEVPQVENQYKVYSAWKLDKEKRAIERCVDAYGALSECEPGNKEGKKVVGSGDTIVDSSEYCADDSIKELLDKRNLSKYIDFKDGQDDPVMKLLTKYASRNNLDFNHASTTITETHRFILNGTFKKRSRKTDNRKLLNNYFRKKFSNWRSNFETEDYRSWYSRMNRELVTYDRPLFQHGDNFKDWYDKMVMNQK